MKPGIENNMLSILIPYLIFLSQLVDPLDSTCSYSANRGSSASKVVKLGAVFTEQDGRRGVTKAFEVRQI